MERRGKFDYILLETTGLADPGNIAPLFWLDEGLGSTIFLDGIVTLVDASNILRCLEDKTPLEAQDPEAKARPEEGLTTAHLQISHADVVVINKQDLITPAELETVKARIESINGIARILVTEHGKVEDLEAWLLDLKAYEKLEDLKVTEKSSLDPVSRHSLFAWYPSDLLDHHNHLYPATITEPKTNRPAGRMAAEHSLGGRGAVPRVQLRVDRRSQAQGTDHPR